MSSLATAARCLLGIGVLAALPSVAALSATSPPLGTPTVTGPRSTTSEQPVYRFRAAHALSFRCAFDSVALHACAARYSQRLAPGRHTLRVRAVGRGGASSHVVAVKISITVPYPRLSTGKAI